MTPRLTVEVLDSRRADVAQRQVIALIPVIQRLIKFDVQATSELYRHKRYLPSSTYLKIARMNIPGAMPIAGHDYPRAERVHGLGERKDRGIDPTAQARANGRLHTERLARGR